MPQHEKIDYVEFPATDIEGTKVFFQKAFGWEFTDYGPGYTAFGYEGLEGGFFKSDQMTRVENGSALIVFYSERLEETQGNVERAGGVISQAIFSFPGGRRFHFNCPSGNEYAVWSDKVV